MIPPNRISPRPPYTLSIITSGVGVPSLFVPVGLISHPPSTKLGVVLGIPLLCGLFCSVVNCGVGVVETFISPKVTFSAGVMWRWRPNGLTAGAL